MNRIFLLFGTLLPFNFLLAQTSAVFAPDSAANLPRPGATGSYAITNPLNHNGVQFANPPITVNCILNCVANDLYLYDAGINIPPTATLTGIEVIHQRGACNGGSFMIDTVFLAYQGMSMGQPKRDSSSISVIDTLGSSSDLWGTNLTPAMVNDPSFGVIIRSTGTGVCTYAPWNVQLILHFDCDAGQAMGHIPDSVVSVPRPGSNGAYAISNPLLHNGNQFTNPPTTVMCAVNCVADHLYFKDFGFAIPGNAQITGVAIQKTSGACNQGSYMTDTLQLAYQGNVIGQVKSDSSGIFYTANFGASNDNWGAVLTPAMVNDPDFGVFVTSTSNGVCTYLQTDLKMDVHYCLPQNTAIATELLPTFQIHPNPVSGDCIFRGYEPTHQTYVVIDIQGRVVKKGLLTPQETFISMRDLPAGLYVVQLLGGSMKMSKMAIN